jgi:hypothetical protein
MSDGTDPAAPVVVVPATGTPYHWDEGWGELPPPPDPSAWSHPGLVVDSDGSVLVADTAAPIVHRLDGASGVRIASFPLPTTEVHGLACEPGVTGTRLWVADQGVRLTVEGGETIRSGPGAGRVIRGDLAAGDWSEVEAPAHPVYRERPYRPTFIAFDPGSDDVWIADGYGGHVVHRYGRDGSYRSSIGDGQGAPFDTPHGVWVDRRGREPRLLVTDRIHRRIAAYDLDGTFRGEFGGDVLTSPSGIVGLGDLAIVAELHGRLAVIDADDRFVGTIGAGDLPDDREAWPNARHADGSVGRPAFVPGRFNSPHAVDVGRDGSLLVAEFVLGGRLVRLTPD